MQPMPRQHMIGPVLTILLSTVAFIVQTYIYETPAPATLPFMGVLYTAYVGGIAPGMISSMVVMLFAAAFLSEPGSLLHYDADGWLRLSILCAAISTVTMVIGTLRARAVRLLDDERDARHRAEASNRELLQLRAALDRIDQGVVLLDGDLRTQFANRAFIALWRLPSDTAARHLRIDEMIEISIAAGIYAPQAHLDGFVADRIDALRTGDEMPNDMRLADGRVIRSSCTPLPEGGRMVSYTDVTDLVDHANALAQLATVDGMTDLYNRRHFQTLAQRAFERAREMGQPLSLMIVDIDHFKSINDRFGHAAGDDVIRHLAAQCRALARDVDVVGRMGGDEFVLLMPNTDIDRAAALAERLRRAVCAEPIVADGREATLTVSIGVAEVTPAMRDPAELMKDADAALYEAKRSERNRVARAGGAPPAAPRSAVIAA